MRYLNSGLQKRQYIPGKRGKLKQRTGEMMPEHFSGISDQR